jgi:hypothetical protein
MRGPPEVLPPPAIVAERDRLIGRPYFMRAWRPTLDRLSKATATAPDGGEVRATIWNQLSRREPIIARAQLIEQSKWSPRIGEVPDDEKWSDRDIALQVVFLNSFFLTVSGVKTITAAEKKRLVDSYREQARRLRKEAAWFKRLEMGLASEAAEHGRAVERAAAWCKAEADEMASEEDPSHPLHDNTLVVGRHRKGLPHVRAYCIRLAQIMYLLYDDVLYGTVASIASVALDCSVTKQQVIDWTRGVKAS